MGIDPAGGGIHTALGQLSRPAQRGEGLRRRLGGGVLARFRTLEKIGPQGNSTALESVDIHIMVAPAVGAVHQPRLRRDTDLVK